MWNIFGSDGGYDPDEALRVTAVELMFEGHTYLFRVTNTGGRFKLIMEEHFIPGQPGEDDIRCRHTGAHADPCCRSSRDLKSAGRESIEEHIRKFHHLKTVK